MTSMEMAFRKAGLAVVKPKKVQWPNRRGVTRIDMSTGKKVK